jgi:hypothetical protein
MFSSEKQAYLQKKIPVMKQNAKIPTISIKLEDNISTVQNLQTNRDAYNFANKAKQTNKQIACGNSNSIYTRRN